MPWRGANVGEPDWETLRDAKIALTEAVGKDIQFFTDPNDQITVRRGDLAALLEDAADYLKDSRVKVRLRETDSGRRFLVCRACSDVKATINALPRSQMNSEILNQLVVLQRMILIQNDGQVSPQTVRLT